METTVAVHHGPYESIADTASPGLRFLKRFLPIVDSVEADHEPIGPFFTPNAPILIGSNPPNTASQTTPLLEVRTRHLSHFHHEVHVAWDLNLSNIDKPNRGTDGEGHVNAVETNLYAPLPGNIQMKRTVMFEATSETIFKNDPDKFPIKIREFNILDLEGRDEDDLQVVEMRVFLDSRPVQARAALLNMGSTFSESKTEAEPP